MQHLSIGQARDISLRAQGLTVDTRPRDMPDLLGRLGAVQLDTISVLARSHELVSYARLGAIGRSEVESALWSQPATTFEYWSHAMCVLPIESYPWQAFRRRYFVQRSQRWHDHPAAKTLNDIRAALKDGPLGTKDFGGAKKSEYWWDWSDHKIGLEWLLDIGEVVCTKREGWRRQYALAEQVIPKRLRERRGWVDDEGVIGPANADCLDHLAAEALRTLGVGTAADITDVHRFNSSIEGVAGAKQAIANLVDQGIAIPVQIPGWKPAYLHRDAAPWLDLGKSASRTTLLSPFDSLVWFRDRLERLFGMVHRIEAYTPASKRVHGYFAMPVLHRGKLVGRVDPAREKDVLVAKTVTLQDTSASTLAGTTKAVTEAAKWVGASAVRVEKVNPTSASAALKKSLGST